MRAAVEETLLTSLRRTVTNTQNVDAAAVATAYGVFADSSNAGKRLGLSCGGGVSAWG